MLLTVPFTYIIHYSMVIPEELQIDYMTANIQYPACAISLTPDINTKCAAGFHSLDLSNSHHTLISPCVVECSIGQDQSVTP